MDKKCLKDCRLDQGKLDEVIAIGIFGSYHESCFSKEHSDIDVMILTSKQVEWEEEMDIEDYLQTILPVHFKHNKIHYTFIHDFNYPFSELLLISKDKIIFNEESYLDYILGYSTFKRDRENLEIMREYHLRELEKIKNGIL